MEAELPSGTVTFLFTDLEGSTRLWEADPDGMPAAVARHHELLDGAIRTHGGFSFANLGDGIAAAFATAPAAVAAAVDAQLALTTERWHTPSPLRARMGIHTGEGRVIGDNYESYTPNRCARLMGAAHGGQLVVSGATEALVRGDLPADIALVDLGEHRLRDLQAPMRVFQVTHPLLQSEFPPLRSQDAADDVPPSNLPGSLDRFIGRTRELEDVAVRLEDSRLLTLLGPGGTGKTRLAVEAARALLEPYADRVYFVDLSASRDVDSLLAVTARAVGVHDRSCPLLDAIKGQIGVRPVLVVMDNFEQVTAAAPAVAELLHDCPGLKVLVTSREALNIAGEHVVPIPPLGLPGSEPGPHSAAELGESEAVQLFVERARAVRADFRLTDENVDAVIEICRRLDGLPLALELATARLAVLTPQELVDRLADRLDLLKGGNRDAPDRQRALRATINWSHELLTPSEQRLLAVLSVFSGFTLEAAEQVAGRVVAPDVDVLDGVSSLVQKSLVRQIDAAPLGTRFAMLETIRDFAAEQLAADAELLAAARRAHADYFADWARQHSEKVTGDERAAVAERMVADVENLNAAWRYWVAEDGFEELAKLTDGLWLLYGARGWYYETAALITDLLDVLSSTPSSAERLVQQILLQTSLARVMLATEGYTEGTERAYARALELCEALGELPQLLPVLRGLSTYYVYRAEFEQAARIGEQLLALAERFDDARARVEGHLLVGASEGMLARLQEGIDHLQQGVEAYEAAPRTVERFEAGNDSGVVCQIVEAMLLWMRGFPDRARDLAYGAVELAERLDHPPTVAYAHFHTGLIHLWLREGARAAEHASTVIALAEAHSFPVWTAAGSCIHGAAIATTGSVAEGLAGVEDAIDQYRALKAPPVFWPALLQLHATVLGLAGRPADALASIDEALAAIDPLPEQRTLTSELALLKGRLLVAHGDRADDAERWLTRALGDADRLDAPMLQLRAATALAELRRAGGRLDEAQTLLAEAYARLTEGFATADLIDARRLLDELEAAA